MFKITNSGVVHDFNIHADVTSKVETPKIDILPETHFQENVDKKPKKNETKRIVEE